MNQKLRVRIKSLFAEHRGRYGSPRIHDTLHDEGFRTSRKRICRIMVEEKLIAQKKRKFVKTTNSDHHNPVVQNLLQQDFSAQHPNQKWASDITYIRTWEGWVYLAVIMDLYSRRIVGWSAANHMREELVLEALGRALGNRCVNEKLIHHSDRGVHYTANEYQRILRGYKIQCSMSGKGNCFDNAVVESFFATLKKELVYRSIYRTRQEGMFSIHQYIGTYYNSRRKHSSLGNKTPMEYEQMFEENKRKVA